LEHQKQQETKFPAECWNFEEEVAKSAEFCEVFNWKKTIQHSALAETPLNIHRGGNTF
jgi:hypothetical protein